MNKQQTLSAIKSEIETIGFDLNLSDNETNFNHKNTLLVERFIEDIERAETTKTLSALLEQYKDLPHLEDTAPLKTVYIMLKDRKLHPHGEFDKQGRFYLTDGELANAKAPSVKYPYSHMKAGRTADFVRAIAKKYKCQTLEELINCFKKA